MGWLDKIVKSRAYKNFMTKLYGIGASLVILGALFKITHWPGATIMLSIGMITESVIFFFSAFEEQPVIPDWSLVYPELWGYYHPDEPMDEEMLKKIEARKAAEALGTGGEIVVKDSVTQKLDKMLEEAKIGPELIESLAEGMRNLSENAKKLSGLADATTATDNFVTNLNTTANTVAELNQTYSQTKEATAKVIGANLEFADNLKNIVSNFQKLSQATQTSASTMEETAQVNKIYAETIQNATNSANQLAKTYIESSEMLVNSTAKLDFQGIDNVKLREQFEKITNNLAALNSIYEVQLNEMQNQLSKVKSFGEGVEDFTTNVQEMLVSIQEYKSQTQKLTLNLQSLNTVYGNMLAAMSINR
ncbi:MAG TPA: gliding motility protein GldL [Bacteroidales bacterium]|jgi:gliding motility-associated protein GldL|nr:gliding motility protein GldL [Bacteroidales bacterium]HOB77440.1 gliding motility protein GldL [Bacteroidales bacterium]HPZ61508.1 gliding motility protein GldL [Bacteroidales bacterium]HQD59156.1 gliding motility protein GldL [Bacteroidales bacterium]